jgi:hypothetical protein
VVTLWKELWLNRKSASSIKVIDAEKELIKIAWIEWKDHEANLESYEIQLRESEKWTFANVSDDANGKPCYLWGPIKNEGDQNHENQITASPRVRPRALVSIAYQFRLKSCTFGNTLDAGFCRHDGYAHRFPTVIAANAAIQKITTKGNI